MEVNMLEAIDVLKNCKAPFRWFMLDDGYLHEMKRQLLTFGHDKKKFPNGLKPLTAVKEEMNIKIKNI